MVFRLAPRQRRSAGRSIRPSDFSHPPALRPHRERGSSTPGSDRASPLPLPGAPAWLPCRPDNENGRLAVKAAALRLYPAGQSRRGAGAARRAWRRGPHPRRRPEPDADAQHAAVAAEPVDRHQPDRRAQGDRSRQRHNPHRRARPPCRGDGFRHRRRAPAAGRRRHAACRPCRDPQPRHVRRLDRARRPGGRAARLRARAGCGAGAGERARAADGRRALLLQGSLRDRARRRRDPGRDPHPGARVRATARPSWSSQGATAISRWPACAATRRSRAAC